MNMKKIYISISLLLIIAVSICLVKNIIIIIENEQNKVLIQEYFTTRYDSVNYKNIENNLKTQKKYYDIDYYKNGLDIDNSKVIIDYFKDNKFSCVLEKISINFEKSQKNLYYYVIDLTIMYSSEDNSANNHTVDYDYRIIMINNKITYMVRTDFKKYN